MQHNILFALITKADFAKSQIVSTETKSKVFEKNVRSKFIFDCLIHVIEMIQEHESFIGKMVNKKKKSFSYVFIENEKQLEECRKDFFNPIEEEKVLFTDEMYETFLKAYIKYQIEYYTKALLERPITCNSTDKLSNLVFEWQLEETQWLISFYKDLLN